MTSHAKQYLLETCTIASQIDAAQIEAMARELVALRDRGGRLFVIGLGGSAANASHAVNDFRKLCGIEAYAPTDNVAELTARANDDGWNLIFESMFEFMTHKDAVFVFSVGGGSASVSAPISAIVRSCKQTGYKVFGIVGRDGGDTAAYGNHILIIPTVKSERVTPHTEGWQSVVLHCLVSHPNLQRSPTKW